MVDRVEERLQVAIDCIHVAFDGCALERLDCVVRSAFWTEAEAMFAELRLKQQRNYLSDGLLDHTIQYRGDAQWALVPVVLRYPDAAHRGWSVGSLSQLSLYP